jgi:hypothetical protein
MLRDIRMLLEDVAAISALQAKRIHAMLIGIIVASLVIITIMWGINIAGGKQINIIFFLLGGLYIILQTTKPVTVTVAAGAGAVVAGLADKDLSQGALTGLKALYRVTIGALFGFWALAGLLATWSFQENPASFFYVMAMVLTIAVTVELFGMKSNKLTAKVIIIYASAVITVAFWDTITDDWKNKIPSNLPTLGWFGDGTKVAKVDGKVVYAPTSDSLGVNGIISIGVHDTMVHVAAEHPLASRGAIYLGCARIIAPDVVYHDARAPKVHVVKLPRARSYINHLVLSDEMKKYLNGRGITQVQVEWKTKEMNGAKPTCGDDGHTTW